MKQLLMALAAACPWRAQRCSGSYLIASGKKSDKLSVFKIDKRTGA